MGKLLAIWQKPAVPVAELLFGMATLPAGRRKDMLTEALDGLLGLFRDRVLPFDTMPPGVTPSWL
jgi:hypothetical protein